MKYKTKRDAVEHWMGSWSYIPSSVIEVIEDHEDGITRLTKEEPEYGYPAAWPTMFTFKNDIDEEWAEKHVELFERAGLVAYDVPHLGFVFGVDGAGYDFYEIHWIPLYESRGLQWHEQEVN